MRVLLVEDKTMLRESLAHTLNSEFDIEVVETLGDAANVMEVLCSTPVDIILMDVCTEGGSSGIVAAKKGKGGIPGDSYRDNDRITGNDLRRPCKRSGRR